MSRSADDPVAPTGRPRRRAALAAWVLAALGAVTAPALANGGIVRIARAPVGPWLVTVYSSPTPLRTGEVDISVLVQDSADVIVDVPVAVRAAPAGFVAETVYAPATRAQATNKLFKAAKFDLGVPGRWEFGIRVGSAATRAEAPGPAGPPSAGDTAGPTVQVDGGGPPDVGDPPGGIVSFEAVVNRTTILDRPFLLATLIALPLLVLGWLLLGREAEPVRDPEAPRDPSDAPELD